MIRPHKNKVLVKSAIQGEEFKTEGGIILDSPKDQMSERVIKGTVESIGPECKTIFVGENVILERKTLIALTEDSIKYYIVNEDDILASY